jgi:hypothetical protein
LPAIFEANHEGYISLKIFETQRYFTVSNVYLCKVLSICSTALLVVRRLMLFARFHFMMAMCFVRKYARACTSSGADNCANRSTNLRANHRSANSATGDELGLRVVMVVMGMCLRDGVFVRLLRERRAGQRKNGCGYGGCCECIELHMVPPAIRFRSRYFDRTSSPMA